MVRGGRDGDLTREVTEVGGALLVAQASLGGNLGGSCGGPKVSPLGNQGCLCDLQSPLLEVSWDPKAHPSLSPGKAWLALVFSLLLSAPTQIPLGLSPPSPASDILN